MATRLGFQGLSRGQGASWDGSVVKLFPARWVLDRGRTKRRWGSGMDDIIASLFGNSLPRYRWERVVPEVKGRVGNAVLRLTALAFYLRHEAT